MLCCLDTAQEGRSVHEHLAAGWTAAAAATARTVAVVLLLLLLMMVMCIM
jgi:hypothetical protein